MELTYKSGLSEDNFTTATEGIIDFILVSYVFQKNLLKVKII